MTDYISREAAKKAMCRMCEGGAKLVCGRLNDCCTTMRIFNSIPAADVRPVVVCANCEYNNHCLTQEFMEDCGKIPLDRNTFFCADGERRNDA